MGKKNDKETFYANRGVERNKRPLHNITYIIDIIKDLKNPIVLGEEHYEFFKFKDLGYIVLLSKHKDIRSFHGFRTPQQIKELLGEKQWSKFCQGKREFIIQRRVNGKNVKKNGK